MTVLDFDPPPPNLRLVSTTGVVPARTTRLRTSATLYGAARDLYREVLEFSLTHQRRVDADALRVVLATKQATCASSARGFSSAGIWQLMFVDVVAWCRNRQLDVPSGCAHALTEIVAYLDVTESFDPLSDPADTLFEAIDECTGGWADEPHPCDSQPSSSPARARRSLRSGRGPKFQ